MKRFDGNWLARLRFLARQDSQTKLLGQSSSDRGQSGSGTGQTRTSGKKNAEQARLADSAVRIRNAAAALTAGTLLYFLVAWLEQTMRTDLATAVLLEEACKTGLLFGFAILGLKVCPRKSRPRESRPAPTLPEEVEGLIWGLAAIVVFATAENLAYFAAFPGGGIFLRLVWSEPVHLVSALAEAEAIWLLVRILKANGGKKDLPYAEAHAERAQKRESASFRMATGVFSFLAIAIAWHLAFNLAADGPVQALERSGDEAGLAWRSAIFGALVTNLAALSALGYHFAHRVIVGGFLYGSE